MDKLGQYKIIERIGAGNMGVVYKALHPLMQRVVAVKTMSSKLGADDHLRARFFREAQAVAQLSHKNIVTVYDMGEDGGEVYLAMEFLDGEDLKETIIRHEPAALEERVKIMLQVCQGLAHAHGKGVIHRDVKPGNIFITRDGDVKILDFGLARLAASDATGTSDRMGTPAYMSPELLRSAKVDARSDIYSAGVVFYELLTFNRAFFGDTLPAIFFKIVHHDPEPIETVNPLIPHRLSEIVKKSMAKDAAQRYQSMDEMADDLNDFRYSLQEQKRGLQAEAREALARLEGLILDNKDLLQDAAEKLEQTKRDAPTLFSSLGVGEQGEGSVTRAAQLDFFTLAEVSERAKLETQRLALLLEKRKQAAPRIGEALDEEKKGNLRNALEIIEGVLRDDPLDPNAISLQQRLLTRLREKELEERKEQQAHQLFSEAEARFSRGEFARCLDALAGVLSFRPGYQEAIDLKALAERSLAIEAELEEKRKRAGALTAAARKALAAKAFMEASKAANEALKMLPDSAELSALVEQITREEEVERARREWEAHINRLLTEARSLKEAGDEDGAIKQLEVIFKLEPAHAGASRLMAEIDQARQRRAEADRLYSAAAEKFAAGDIKASAALSAEALKLQPGHAGAADLLRRAEESIELRAKQEQAKQITLQALGAFREALAAENLAEARAQLDRAREISVVMAADDIVSVDLERAEAEYRDLVERLRRIEEMSARARALGQSGDYEAALSVLNEIDAFAPGRSETSRLAASIRQFQEDRERAENERRQRIEEYFAGAQRAEQRGDFEEADRLANAVLSEETTHTGARALLARIEVRLAEIRRAEEVKRARVQALVDQARLDISVRRFEQAIEALDEALRLGGSSPELAQLRRTTAADLQNERDREARRAEGLRQKQLGSDLLASKQHKEGLAALNRAKNLLGEDPVILSGIAEAEEAIRAEERLAQIRDQVVRSRQALSRRDFKQASECARRVVQLDPHNQEIKEILENIERGQEVQRRRDEIADLLAQGHQMLVREEFQQAAKSATEALLLNPENTEAKQLLTRIDQAQEGKHRRESSASLLAQSKQAFQRMNFEEAAIRVRELLLLDPQNAEGRNLLKQIELAQERKSRKEQVASLLIRAHQDHRRKELIAASQTAKEILLLEPGNKEARALLKEIERDLKQEQKERQKRIRAEKRQEELLRQSPEAAARQEMLLRRRTVRFLIVAIASVAIIASSWMLLRTFRQESYARDTQSLIDQGEYERAAAAAERWLNAFPDNSRALNLKSDIDQALQQRGQFLAALKALDYPKAHRALDQLAKTSPKDPKLTQYRKQMEDSFSAEFIDQFLGDFSLWDAPNTWETGTGRLIVKNGMGLIRGRYYRDFQASFNITFISGDTASWILRAADPKNYYRFQLTGPNGDPPNSLIGFKIVDSRETTILAPTKVGKDLGIEGDQLEITVRTEGDRIRQFIKSGMRPEEGDPKEMASIIDASIPAGTLGFSAMKDESFSVRALGIVSKAEALGLPPK